MSPKRLYLRLWHKSAVKRDCFLRTYKEKREDCHLGVPRSDETKKERSQQRVSSIQACTISKWLEKLNIIGYISQDQ